VPAPRAGELVNGASELRVAKRSGSQPRLAITLGDPRGIGPEIVGRALGNGSLRDIADFIVVGPANAFAMPDESVGSWSDGNDVASAGRCAGAAIERAVAMAGRGDVDGIVTAPIDKAALLAGGFDFPGHTEMLASLTGAETAMMLASDRLRVVLATTHIPLRSVPDAVTVDAITTAARLTFAGLREGFGIDAPRIALCAMNPHAGDSGRFGSEDDDILRPAALASGLHGPFPADTVFVRALRGEFDAVIAPYHDVGMTAIKVASFGSAVNITLGLPFPRTSPDHGTALDIAGKGIADPSSMIRAIQVCVEIINRRRQSRTLGTG
jgi:4-hydroxythreonine-4-phosphate dehydrogenase